MSWGSRPTLGAAAVVQMKQLFILDYKKIIYYHYYYYYYYYYAAFNAP